MEQAQKKDLTNSLAKDLARIVMKPACDSRRSGCKSNLEAKCFQRSHSPTLLLYLVAFDEEVATQFLEGGLRILEEVIDNGNDRMRHGHGCAFGAASCADALELSREIGVFRA